MVIPISRTSMNIGLVDVVVPAADNRARHCLEATALLQDVQQSQAQTRTIMWNICTARDVSMHVTIV